MDLNSKSCVPELRPAFSCFPQAGSGGVLPPRSIAQTNGSYFRPRPFFAPPAAFARECAAAFAPCLLTMRSRWCAFVAALAAATLASVGFPAAAAACGFSVLFVLFFFFFFGGSLIPGG